MNNVVLSNIRGEVIQTYLDVSDNELIIDIEKYPSGLYMFTIVDDEGQKHTEKLIKM